MPGKIIDIMVEEGVEVKEGEPIIILEAMKMQNELAAAVSGTVAGDTASLVDGERKSFREVGEQLGVTAEAARCVSGGPSNATSSAEAAAFRRR